MKNAIHSRKIRIAFLLGVIGLLGMLGATAFLIVSRSIRRETRNHFIGSPAASSHLLSSQAFGIRFSPDGKFLLVAGEVTGGKSGRFQASEDDLSFQMRDKRLRLFDVAKQKEIERLKAEPLFGGWNGEHMLLMPDFKTLITNSHYSNVKVIDIRKRVPDRSIELLSEGYQVRETITDIKLSPDEKVLALGTIDGARFYHAHNLKQFQSYDHYGGNWGTDVYFGRNSDVVKLVYGGSKNPHFVNVKTGKRIPTPRSTREFEVTFSPDRKYFADVISKNQIDIWQHDARQSFKIGTVRSTLVQINTVQFSPDNKTLVVGGLSSTETPVQSYKLADIRTGNKAL